MYTMTACLLGAVLAQQQHSNDNRNSKPAVITVPERMYYCNVAQVASGICTQLPFGTTTRSVTKAKQTLSLDECNLVCGGRGQDKSGGDSLASLWPLPTSRYSLGSQSGLVRGTCPRQDWVFQFSGPGNSGASGQLLNDATKVLFDTLESQYGAVANCKAHGALGPILIQVHVQTAQATLQLHTDESYNLTFNLADKSPSKSPTIAITASTFFGARNAMETLSQLVGRPPVGSTAGLSIVQSATVSDAPAFTYRGIMLDTARHFLPIATLQSTIKGMAASKLNTLHLHLTDTGSVPIHLASQPNITAYGAYGNAQTYSAEDIQQLVQFATVRGVRVVPEIDAPAHVRMGWTDWTEEAGMGKVVVCTEDWASSALEPPGGQLDPTNPHAMELLSDVYKDVVAAFQQPDVFHLGGDEVIVGCDDHTCGPAGCVSCWASCWNSSKKAPNLLQHLADLGLPRTDPQSFYAVWKNFTKEAFASLKGAYGAKAPQKVLQWGGTASAPSSITYNLMGESDLHEILPPSDFVIEVWDNLNGSIAPQLMDQGYDVVLAHTDYVYLDCGEGGWAKPGGYWCQPYHEWFRIYQYLPDALAMWTTTPASRAHILGSEVLMWGEAVDEHNLEPKVWPRAAALAERFWSNPTTGWFEASPRMQLHRQRLVERGLQPAALQTQWCSANGAHACTLDIGDQASNVHSFYSAPGVPQAQQVSAANAVFQSDTHGAV